MNISMTSSNGIQILDNVKNAVRNNVSALSEDEIFDIVTMSIKKFSPKSKKKLIMNLLGI